MNTTQKAAAGNGQPDEPIYQKRKKIYAREVQGPFARLRWLAVLVLLGLYYFLPWIDFDGHQSVLFDLPDRKFYLFGLTFWPQDFFYLAWLLVIAALALFFFTTLAGRLWCGYACPQTVWTEVFMWIEHRIEGDRPKQMKLDRMPLNATKFRIKATKHLLWLLFSAWTGFTFVGFFTPIRELSTSLMNLSLGPWESFWIFFYGFATYGNAGWLREQVCIYMCPYARFQSAMFDKDTLVIAYDEKRGEPRGARKRGADPQALGLGDCIDCTLCVQVCPTGIDIRNGLQYQCIGCAACIDVCDQVMEKMGYPKGLIRYTTENRMEGKSSHILHFRTLLYGGLLLLLSAGLVYSISQRVPVGLDIIRDRNTLYRETDTGLIENVYILKLINMDERPHSYTLKAEGLPELELDTGREQIEVPAGSVINLPLRLRIDPINLKQPSNEISFTLQAVDDPSIHIEQRARFLGPAGG
ncbi:cytochrome c oxidase accessory protein CcoG [Thiohalobacter sp. IOR34]|uniref:cytochrome c oxidase accessory protein CcoG n=1 Tax=Thiohalobacter sp. IOR34 TaxID=3057176 RepID=UPI0025B0180A|nr:cytochrome c oxidase accessory protein CcoG [Thiohalobacter sp. IOR34]WJW75636.1 cytochrome c oxidase accessory protein CcoG [Thiohalobacter sp. IOR34]